MLRVSRRDVPVMVVVTVVLLIPAIFLSDFHRYVATSGVIIAIAILGLGVVTGRAGMISLAQMSFMAVGAWVVMYLQVNAPGIPFLLKLAIGTLAAVPVGVLLSLPALHLRGISLGVVTLAFAAAFSVFLRVQGFPGVASGNYVKRPDFLASDGAYYWFCALVFIVFLAGVTLLGRTSIGASWSAIRESERATAALGRRVAMAKMSAFAVSALCAGAAGSLLAGQLGTSDPATYSPLKSISLFALAIMVGARYGEGALIGGALFAFMPLILTAIGLPGDVGDFLFGVGAIIGLRRGMGISEDIREGIHRRRRKTEIARATTAASLPDDARSPRPLGPTLRGTLTSSSGLPSLEIVGLTQSYGAVRALDNVSLTVPSASVAALIGPNGAGKSTLIDCVTGFIQSYTGSVTIDGRAIDGLPASERARSGVRRTFQQGRTISDLTVEKYIRLGLSRAQRAELTEREFQDLLEFFDCPPMTTRISDIDVGTRRLLEVAAAVAARPNLVLLDEPAAGLGGTASVRLAHKIAEIPMRFGSAVLLVEHDIELVALAASHLIVIDFGQVIATGDPEAVLSDPIVVDAYLGQEVAS